MHFTASRESPRNHSDDLLGQTSWQSSSSAASFNQPGTSIPAQQQQQMPGFQYPPQPNLHHPYFLPPNSAGYPLFYPQFNTAINPGYPLNLPSQTAQFLYPQMNFSLPTASQQLPGHQPPSATSNAISSTHQATGIRWVVHLVYWNLIK